MSKVTPMGTPMGTGLRPPGILGLRDLERCPRLVWNRPLALKIEQVVHGGRRLPQSRVMWVMQATAQFELPFRRIAGGRERTEKMGLISEKMPLVTGFVGVAELTALVAEVAAVIANPTAVIAGVTTGIAEATAGVVEVAAGVAKVAAGVAKVAAGVA